jgi:hypothetical protein
VIPHARAAYIDNDPAVISRNRALLAKGAGLAAAQADVTSPAAVLADSAVRAVIDPRESACVLLGLVLHLMDV